ncbi:MAG: radical SAM protein [Candidatus Competibacter sp.]
MKNERILFVIPPYFSADDYITSDRSRVLPPFTVPYGVLSLDAYLKRQCGDQVSCYIVDLNITLKNIVDSVEKQDCFTAFSASLTAAIHDFEPSMIGISALFNISFQYIEEIAKTAKQADDRLLILTGGGLPSAAYQQVLRLCPSVDAVCKGEGELPLADLVMADDRAALLESHPSWITRIGLSSNKKPEPRFIKNLDEIPMLNYEMIDLDNYNSRSLDKRYSGIKKREMAIHTSRGCPFSCVFCSNPFLHGKKMRAMSVERVIDEVRVMKEQHGLTVLLIEDDHFLFDTQRAKKILHGLSELNIRIEFPNGIAVYAIDEELAALLYQAGVSTVALAIESGSDYVLNKIIKKPLKTNIVKSKVEMLRKQGVLSHAFIVVGLPGEQASHRRQTLELLLDIGVDWAHVFCAVPIFGSRLHEICVENGYIENSNFLDHINTKSVIKAPGVDPQEIEKTAYQINLLVNFVHNFNLKTGNYQTAIQYFSNVAEKYPQHAFAHHALARAYAGAGRSHDADASRDRFERILLHDPWWRAQAEAFGLIGDATRIGRESPIVA